MLDREILNFIVCPKCKGELHLEGEFLICYNCKLKYSIKNDIPVLLVEEAIKLEEKENRGF